MIPVGVKIFMATEPVDLRASFYRLATHVRATLDEDPQSGHLYLFIGKGRNLVKILFWDRSGYCIFSKRLARGRFKLPDDIPVGATRHQVDFASLTLFLEGIDLRGATRRPAYQAPRFGGRRSQA